MKVFTNRSVFIGIVFIFFTYFIAACANSSDSAGNTVPGSKLPDTPQFGKMSTFESKEALEDYLKQEFADSSLPSEAYLASSLPEVDQVTDSATVEGTAANTNRFSDTNIQEAGVDESDKVKTDGRYFYVAQRKSVRIAKAQPADAMKSVSRIPIKGFVDALYLYQKKYAS